MRLFDFFRKKTAETPIGGTAPVTGNTVNDNLVSDSSILVESGRHGSQGDHFSALLGFERFSGPAVQQKVKIMMALAVVQQPIMRNNEIAIANVSFEGLEKVNDAPMIRSILLDKKTVSGYPYLPGGSVITFETKKIIEWEYLDGIEADIEGGGQDTFGIGFFATDYAVKKDFYKIHRKLNIRLSAFAYTIQNFKPDPADERSLSNDFAGFFPYKDLNSFSYFDFVGTVLSFKQIQIEPDNTAFIIRTKLINDDTNPDLLVISIFVNEANMQLSNALSIGMSITGLLWFQGEIAG